MVNIDHKSTVFWLDNCVVRHYEYEVHNTVYKGFWILRPESVPVESHKLWTNFVT